MLPYCQLDPKKHILFEIQIFSSKKCIGTCRLPKWRPFCPGGNELTTSGMNGTKADRTQSCMNIFNVTWGWVVSCISNPWINIVNTGPHKTCIHSCYLSPFPHIMGTSHSDNHIKISTSPLTLIPMKLCCIQNYFCGYKDTFNDAYHNDFKHVKGTYL